MFSNVFLGFLLLLLVFVLYYMTNQNNGRLLVLLFASCVFYGWFEWKFLFLLLFVILTDYLVARALARQEGKRQRYRLLLLSLIADLSILIVFKYFNFFASSFASLLNWFGIAVSPVHVDILAPIGISFFVFKSLSYTIDVYFRRIPPEKSFLRYAVSIAFFPQLLAGPIMRPREFLPQLQSSRPFDSGQMVRGLSRAILGAFKKLVIADSLAPLVMIAFDKPAIHSSMTLALGAIFYAFQIYADFSGYSDIAIGLGQMLGFRCVENFDRPYVAKSPSEFWRRWHMSLSTWLRDYIFLPVFYPLQRTFSRFVSSAKTADKWGYGTASMVTMLCAGLWHGAAWTFVVWGAIHGMLMSGQRLLLPSPRKRRFRKPPMRTAVSAFAFLITFTLVTLCWIIFRSSSLSTAAIYLKQLFAFTPTDWGAIPGTIGVVKGTILIIALIICEWAAQTRFLKQSLARPFSWLRLLASSAAVWAIALFGSLNGQPFIYFQF